MKKDMSAGYKKRNGNKKTSGEKFERAGGRVVYGALWVQVKDSAGPGLELSINNVHLVL